MDRTVRRWWPLASAGILCAMAVGALAIGESGSGPARRWLAAAAPLEGALALQPAVLLLAVAVHELGHVLAARAAGVQVAEWRIGPLVARRTGRGWRLRVVPTLLPGGEVRTGSVGDGDLRARYAAMTAGGPAAHLVLAAAAAGLAALSGRPVLWLAAATVTASGLADLLPLELGANRRWTDGRWLLAWLLRPDRAAQRVGTGVLVAALASGRRPREWEERWATLAAAGRQPADGVQVTGCALAYAWALDRGDVDGAARFITRAFAARGRLPSRVRPALAAETAFFVARFRGDPRLAARLLDGDPPGPGAASAADLERARAAIHLAAGRPAEAVAACDRALGALERRRGGGARSEVARELIEAMRAEAAAALAAGGPPARAAI
jgi:hypothetical protein